MSPCMLTKLGVTEWVRRPGQELQKSWGCELRARIERLGGRGFTELSAQSLVIAGCSQLF